MKVVILAGGQGTRISEISRFTPKPMITIGEYPLLWHIMKIFSAYGYNDFIICAGYKSSIIKDYFMNYHLYQSDVTVDLSNFNDVNIHKSNSESWRVTIVETGLDTMTGGRIRRIRKYVEGSPFMLTYGDGLADIDLHKLVQYHQAHGKLATVTAVRPKARFGTLSLGRDDKVEAFKEKTNEASAWVNGGFFVLQPEVFDYISGDDTVFEREPLEILAAKGELMAFRQVGFWHPMDTMMDQQYLEELCREGNPPWFVRGNQQ